MSSKALVSMSSGQVRGVNNQSKHVISAGLTGSEEREVTFTPPNASWGSTMKLDIMFPRNERNERQVLLDCVWGFDFTNASGTDSVVYKTPYDFIDEITVKINNEEVYPLECEEIRLKYTNHFVKHNRDDDIKSEWNRQTQYEPNLASYLDSIQAPSTTTARQCSLMPLLDEVLYHMKTSLVGRVEINIKLKANKKTPQEVGQWMLNSTADSNPLDFCVLNNHEVIFHLRSYEGDVYGPNNHVERLTKYQVDSTQKALTIGEKIRTDLKCDFTSRTKIGAFKLYAVPRPTAYNAANCLQCIANGGAFSLDVRKGGKEYKQLDTPAKLNSEYSHYIRAETGSHARHDYDDASFQSHLPSLPLVNFKNLENHHTQDHAVIIDGFSNGVGREVEVTTTSNIAEPDVEFHQAVEYYELMSVNHNGKISLKA